VAVADTFEALRKILNKPFLNGPNGRAWQGTLGRMMDEAMNRVVQARVARLPSFCPLDGLQYIASERQLERAIGESESAFREVLRTSWTVWAKAGTEGSHQDNLGRMGFGNIIVRRRHDFYGAPDSVPYINAFARDVWAQFDVIASKPLPFELRYWGTGVWGLGTWGTTATAAQIDQLRRFLRTFRAGHDTPMYVYLNYLSGRMWGIGFWGSGVWGGSGSVVRLLVGEDHWVQRGLI